MVVANSGWRIMTQFTWLLLAVVVVSIGCGSWNSLDGGCRWLLSVVVASGAGLLDLDTVYMVFVCVVA